MNTKSKKFLSLFLATLMLFTIIPLTASAATEGYYSYEVTDGKATITNVDKAISGKVTIPSKLGEYDVIAIGDKAFKNCTNITELTIPAPIERLEKESFYNCTNLSKASLAETINYIGTNAFKMCENLKKVYIDNLSAWLNVEIIYAFSTIKTVKGIGPLYYGADLYLDNQLVETLEIPQGTTKINAALFEGCGSIKKVVLPDELEKIDSYAFSKCKNLKDINIPTSVNYIGTFAFSNSSSGRNVHITDIESWFNIRFCTDFEFSYPTSCNPLTNGGNLYLNNQLLEDVIVPASQTTINDCIFEECNSIKTIYIPKSITTIKSSAFYNCENIEKIYYEGTESEWKTIKVDCFNEINYLDGIDIVYNSKLPSVFTSNETAKAVSNTILTTVGITTEQLLSQTDDGAVIKDKEGNVISADTLPGTGMTITLADGKKYEIVVFGDVDGNGKITAVDARLVLRASVELENFAEDSCYYPAANIERTNEKLTATDARLILRASVELENPKNWMP